MSVRVIYLISRYLDKINVAYYFHSQIINNQIKVDTCIYLS